MARVFPALRLGFALALLMGGAPPAAMAAGSGATQTIVLVRHGEKPAQGLGQLDCQGLNRALALPDVIVKGFGKPDAILAPDPAQTKDDLGHPYDYVRPLATIEPTAIALGMPIDASIGVADIDRLRRKLEDPAHRQGLLVVAWEHTLIVKLVRQIMAEHGGDPAAIPDWKWDDFDSIYVVRIAWSGERATVAFEHRQEGLNGQPMACPGHPGG